MRLMYELWYRWGTPPWSGSPRAELMELVESGRLQPCRAIDLGCGIGDNAIFMAQHGFDVTAVDYAASAIRRAREKAAEAGVEVDFHVEDLTAPRHLDGTYDLLVDYGTFDDLPGRGRSAYIETVRRLVKPGTRFLLWCFEWEKSRSERVLTRLLPFGDMCLAPGEAQQRFGQQFEIERIAGETNARGWPKGWAAYLMTTRNGRSQHEGATQ